jgi:hypothetical protein
VALEDLLKEKGIQGNKENARLLEKNGFAITTENVFQLMSLVAMYDKNL